MNKGLEILEARWLFDVPAEDVEVVVHPQSIVHSLVRYRDGSVLAQLGLPDMRLPIQYALVYPERLDTSLPRLDMASLGSLTFEPPDLDKFPALRLARQAAANEAAVARFLERKIGYFGIMETVERVMERHAILESTYENVLAADAWARQRVSEM
jgi:1-deoxy-D-xylulose-5-phosphate reductoisomerase